MQALILKLIKFWLGHWVALYPEDFALLKRVVFSHKTWVRVINQCLKIVEILIARVYSQWTQVFFQIHAFPNSFRHLRCWMYSALVGKWLREIIVRTSFHFSSSCVLFILCRFDKICSHWIQMIFFKNLQCTWCLT